MKIKYPSIELLNNFLDDLKIQGFTFPEFSNSKEILIFSDYSGERKEDSYHAYSFYIIDKEALISISYEILKLREQEPEWKDNSFIEYKNLSGDKVRERILPSFLRIFDNFEGLVITMLVDKKSPNYFMKVSGHDIKLIEALGLGLWKSHILRKSSNILSILSLLVKRFLNQERKLTWYSDRDDIFGGNQSKSHKTLDMLSQFLLVFDADIKDGEFNYISDKHTLINSDFLSIADLSAGAVLDYYQISYQGNDIRSWAKQIIGWMSDNSTKLKKLMIVGKEEGDQKLLISLKNYKKNI